MQILCVSEERQQKERAIRQLQEKRLWADLEKLSARVAQGRLRNSAKVSEAIGRLKQRSRQFGSATRYIRGRRRRQPTARPWKNR